MNPHGGESWRHHSRRKHSRKRIHRSWEGGSRRSRLWRNAKHRNLRIRSRRGRNPTRRRAGLRSTGGGGARGSPSSSSLVPPSSTIIPTIPVHAQRIAAPAFAQIRLPVAASTPPQPILLILILPIFFPFPRIFLLTSFFSPISLLIHILFKGQGRAEEEKQNHHTKFQSHGSEQIAGFLGLVDQLT